MSRTHSESYAPRSFPGHPGDCEEIEGAGTCWGQVRNSSRGMRCEGHRGVVYRPEPQPPTEAEIKAQEAARREADRRNRALMRQIAYTWGYTLEELEEELRDSGRGPKEWNEWQGNRWFRRYTYNLGDVKVPFWIEKLSDPMLLLLHSMIGEAAWDDRLPYRVKQECLRIGAYATREIQTRRLRFPNGPYDLKLAPKQPKPEGAEVLFIGNNPMHALAGAWRDPKHLEPFTDAEMSVLTNLLTDAELRVLEPLTAQVVDYSCLERGTRQAVMSLWHLLERERKLRRKPMEGLLEEVDLAPHPMIVDDPPENPGVVAEGVKGIGYWASDHEPLSTLPHPSEYVDEDWYGSKEHIHVLAYLGRQAEVAQYMGQSPCRICGENNGSTSMSDGVYVWPQGFAHYLDAHSVKPPQEFIDHVLSRTTD
jgi:hypothetical protein